MWRHYIFSGHTTVLTLTNLFICDHFPRSLAWQGIQILSWAASAFGMFFVLAAHEHYTVDVLLAFFLTRWVYSNYRTMCLIQADASCLTSNLYYSNVPVTMAIRKWMPYMVQIENARSYCLTHMPEQERSVICWETMQESVKDRNTLPEELIL